MAQLNDDHDGDGILDAPDNCLLTANPDQRDTDGDGYGNACDGDLNNDGKTDNLDLGLFKLRLTTSDPDADLNGDGIVNILDVGLFKQLYGKPPGPSGPHAQTGPAPVVYLHTDPLGTPRLATDPQRRVVWRWEGNAFGDTAPDADPDGDGHAVTVNLRYAGQYFDGETGLHYNWQRYYDPKLGRYITSDPIGLTGGLNTYAYVANNPLRFTDPLGLFSVSVEAYLGVGGGINISYSGGTLEFTGRLGVGLGGGAAYDPKGTPSPHAKKCGSGHIARTSLNLQAGVGAGPFGVGGSFTAASGNAVTTKVGGGYSSVSITELSLDDSKGFGARLGGSVGVDIGSYSNWGDQQCGCP